MAELKFKQGLYKYYAPRLFKVYKLRAWLKAKLSGLDSKYIAQLAQFYWDGYLVKKFSQELANLGLPIYQAAELSCKQTKCAYILGCGSSINDISDTQWQEVRKHYSVGLNNFYVHDFVADAYFCEFAKNPVFFDLIYKYLLDDPAKASAKVHIAGRYVLQRGDGYRSPKVAKPEFYVSRSVKCTHRDVLPHMVTPEFYFHGSNLSHHISNLDTVIHHCVRQGFKEIVLLGVDLTNDGYFWDTLNSSACEHARAFIDSYYAQLNYQQDSNGRHATASSEVAERLGKLTIVEYLSYVQKNLLTPNGISLCVGNKQSLLADVLGISKNFEQVEERQRDESGLLRVS